MSAMMFTIDDSNLSDFSDAAVFVHPDVAASYALTRLIQRLIELQPLLLDMIVTHGMVDLGELVASLPLNALVERRKLAKRTRET